MNKILDLENELTSRQKSILFAIIKDYCDLGISIGSSELKEKYHFDFSPATIRSEMSKLRDLGFLYQPFTNSSNRPTQKAFRIFINELIGGLQITSARQRDLQERLQELEKDQRDMHREISRLMASQTDGAAFSMDSRSGNVAGYKNLMVSQNPEEEVVNIVEFLERIEEYRPLLLENKKIDTGDLSLEEKKTLQTYYGGESQVLPIGKGYGMVASKINIDGEDTVVGLVTPLHVLARKKNLELLHGLSEILENPKSGKASKASSTQKKSK